MLNVLLEFTKNLEVTFSSIPSDYLDAILYTILAFEGIIVAIAIPISNSSLAKLEDRFNTEIFTQKLNNDKSFQLFFPVVLLHIWIIFALLIIKALFNLSIDSFIVFKLIIIFLFMFPVLGIIYWFYKIIKKVQFYTYSPSKAARKAIQEDLEMIRNYRAELDKKTE